MKKKEILIALLLAGLVTGLTAFFKGFPLRFLKPVICIQMIGAKCPSFRIVWFKLIGDFIFWFLVLAVTRQLIRRFHS